MPDLTDRVIRLEARSDERDRTMDYLRAEMIELRREMASLRSEMQSLATELRGEMAALRGEMAALRDSFDRRFTWLVGLQVAGLVAVIAALLRR